MNTAKKVAIAATAVVVTGGAVVAGAVVVDKLAGTDASALAKVVPSNAVAFGSVNLDPKASQKIKFNDLFGRVKKNTTEEIPLSADDFSASKFLDESLKKCDAPQRGWAGDNMGVAVLPGKDDPAAALYIESNDMSEAKAFAKSINASNGCDFASAVAIDGWVILGSEKGTAKDVSPETSGFKSLSANDEFNSDIGSLKDEGLVTYWVDTNSDYLVEQAGERGKELKRVDSVFGTVRALDNSFELFTHVGVDTDDVKTNGSVGDVLKGVPDGSQAVVAMTGFEDIAKLAADPLVTAQTDGFITPDLAKVFESPVAVAGSDFFGEPTAAVYSAAPLDVVNGAVTQVLTLLGDSQATAGLAQVEKTGGVIRVTAPTQVGVPSGSKSVTSTDAFQDSVGDTDKSVIVAYADGDAFGESFGELPISGLGLNVSTANDGFDTTFRVGIKR